MLMLHRALIPTLLLALAGCASSPTSTPSHTTAKVDVAFAPEAGAEKLVLQVVGSARQSIRLAGYSFTSPSIVRALMEAKRRGVDVRVLIDDKGNRGVSSLAAMNLIASANIPIRVISSYAIHHDKYLAVDGIHVETGSFNYTQAAARSNSENVLVLWNQPGIAARYTAHWESRWAKGTIVEAQY